jgi:hypothetical protein
MQWGTLAVSALALVLSLIAISDARKALKYGVSKDAAEKRASLLKLVIQLEHTLQESADLAARNEPYSKAKPAYAAARRTLESVAGDLEACRRGIENAATIIKLSELEVFVNELEPEIAKAVAAMKSACLADRFISG